MIPRRPDPAEAVKAGFPAAPFGVPLAAPFPARLAAPFPARLAAGLLAALALALLAAGCVSLGLGGGGRAAAPFNAPVDRRLIAGVPFIPDDSSHCGPSTLAAVLTYHGRPTTKEEVAADVQRGDLRGSLGPDLVIWARQRGFSATFKSSSPEELVESIDRLKPVIILLDTGIGPVRKGHFVVALGYSPEGLVVNSGEIQQELAPWSTVLTEWYRSGNFAIVVEGLAGRADGTGDAAGPEAAPGSSAGSFPESSADSSSSAESAPGGPADGTGGAASGASGAAAAASGADASAAASSAAPPAAAASAPEGEWTPVVTQVVVQPAYRVPDDMLSADLPLDPAGAKQPVMSFVGRPAPPAEAEAAEDERPYGVVVEESVGATVSLHRPAGVPLRHEVVPLPSPADDPLGRNAAQARASGQAAAQGQAAASGQAGQPARACRPAESVPPGEAGARPAQVCAPGQAASGRAAPGQAAPGQAGPAQTSAAQPAPTPPGVITVSPFISGQSGTGQSGTGQSGTGQPGAAAGPPRPEAPPEPVPVMGWER